MRPGVGFDDSYRSLPPRDIQQFYEAGTVGAYFAARCLLRILVKRDSWSIQFGNGMACETLF